MDLKPPSTIQEYIHVTDNVVEERHLDVFFKICKERKEFKDGYIMKGKGTGQIKNTDIRNVKIWHPNSISGSMTEAHWTGFLVGMLKDNLNNYLDTMFINNTRPCINEIQILKYKIGGHYKFHTDLGPSNARSISLIFFVNDDYEGGDLCFKDIKNNQELIIEKQKNRLIVWPSNFMYPHSVKPVTKGTRYSVVSWAV